MMMSRYYSLLLIAFLVSTSLATSSQPTTTSAKSLVTITKSSTITSSAVPTRSTICAAAGANCYNSANNTITPYCDTKAECVEGDTVATYMCSVVPPNTSPVVPCVATYGQCGSIDWTGPSCCGGSICVSSGSPYFAQCLPGLSTSSTLHSNTPTSSIKSSTSTSSAPSTTKLQTPVPSCAGEYNQCGGIGFTGPLCCSAGLVCVEFNDSPYFSTCEATMVQTQISSLSTLSKVSTTTFVTKTSTPKVSSSTSVPPPTVTSSAATTTSKEPVTSSSPTSTCAEAGANCAATPCCDASLSCYSQANLSNIPTYICVVPCAFEYGRCGGIGWPGPFCCQAGLTCINDGSPYYDSCVS